jgi:predicted nucleic acid-binding protein
LSAFADTSLLCALYRQQDNSTEADRLMQRESEPVLVSSLVLFEFRQSLRLQAFRFSKDRAQGFSKTEANRMLEALQSNIAGGLFLIPSVEDWAQVYSFAEELSSQHTVQGGYRSFDVLHVATAVHLRAGRFITFDKHQAGLAKAASLDVQP